MRTNGRIMPDFIIVGAMKSGTTTLYRYLAEHPEIGMSRDKETDFFILQKNYGKGPDWYSGQFDPRFAVHGEASPNYTKARDFPGVPERMRGLCPEVRLVYIVRDPVDRAESQFRHSFIMGRPGVDYRDFPGSHEYHHILDASRYAVQLEEYLKVFPASSVQVLDFDNLVRDPQSVVDVLCDHIGVSRAPVEASAAQNDSAELSRIPAPILRFAQSPLGKSLSGLVFRDTRDRVRRALAWGQSRIPDPFPEALRQRVREDLASDADRFRELTGRTFAGWSV